MTTLNAQIKKETWIEEKTKFMYNRHDFCENENKTIKLEPLNTAKFRKKFLSAQVVKFDHEREAIVDFMLKNMIQVAYLVNERLYSESIGLIYQCILLAREFVDFTMIIELATIMSIFMIKMDHRSKLL